MSTLSYKRPVIVGIFILFAIAILVVTIFTLGGQKKSFVKSYTLHAVFNDVGGLLKGGNIWFSGMKVGTVKSISFFGDSQVEVTMSIENLAQQHIHKDALAKVGSDGLIGNKIILIYGGSESSPPAQANDFLHVETAISTDDMMATLQANNKNLLEITSDFKNISKKMNSGQGMVATLLNDTVIVRTAKHTLHDAELAVANFKMLSEKSKIISDHLATLSANLDRPGHSLHDIASDTVMYGMLKKTMTNIDEASRAIALATGNLQKASGKLNENKSVAGVLINDPASAGALKTTLSNLESSSRKLNEDLEALQHTFLLRGFFRKRSKAGLDTLSKLH
jgi:phospholipid/cholesterol/gamma-HCH transport system substrate-binding protein